MVQRAPIKKSPKGTVLAWKCGHCAKGMLVAPNSQAGKYARLMHAKEAHPGVAIKNFHMNKGEHYQKAADAHKVQGRLKGVLLAKEEGHQVAFYTVPWGPRKGITHVICKLCHKEAATVGRLSICDPGDPSTRPRTKSIKQLSLIHI